MATPQQQAQQTTTLSPLDLGITLTLHNWPALSMAVTSNWGGPTSSDKRDWFCGAISDMLADRPETDAEDLEDVLVQVMSDEFDVVVDDESAAEVAGKIMEIRGLVARGEVGVVRELWESWASKRGRTVRIQRGEGGEEEEDDSDEEEDGDEDDEMDEAPTLVNAPRERVGPEVDEDGFTKVAGKKRR